MKSIKVIAIALAVISLPIAETLAQSSQQDSLAFVKLSATVRKYSRQISGFEWYSDSGKTNDTIDKTFTRLKSRFNRSLVQLLHNSYSLHYPFKRFENISVAE